MKALIVTGNEDFAALTFVEEFEGTPVTDVINNGTKSAKCGDRVWNEKGAEIEIRIVEAGHVNPDFINQIRGMFEHDTTKDMYFWMEDEKIGYK